MKIRTLLSFLILLVALPVRSDIFLELSQDQVKQGSLISGKLKFDLTSLSSEEVPKLRGQTLGDVLYVHQIGPLVGRGGSSVYEADAKLIFLKVPSGTAVPAAGGNLRWGTLTVIPTEAPKELLFGNFSVPARRKLLLWGGIAALLILGGLLFLKVWRVFQPRRKEKIRRQGLKQTLLSANDFDKVVELWRSKHTYLSEFPHITDPFLELESVLFKYQFKPSQSDAERSEVLQAYRRFTEAVTGGFNGV